MKPQTVPAWFTETDMSGHLRRQLLKDFTIHARGYVCWYKGKPRWVCGKGVAPAEVHDAWEQKRKAVDREAGEKIVRKRSGYTVREAAGLFYAFLDYRVTHAQPKALSPYSRADYVRYVNEFGRTVGADRRIDELEPGDFSAFAKKYAGRPASELSRAVANVRGFFSWCGKDGLIRELPAFGSYFVKPAKQEHRDERIEQTKSYTIRELRALWNEANPTERLWMGLGLNAALDNADLANFTEELIDWKAGTIDYRRRKVGKARRVVPLRPEVLELLRKYKRPEPAVKESAGLFFLTEKGLPLARMVASPDANRVGLSNNVDAIARIWRRLLVRAGLRKKPKVIFSKGRGKTRQRKLKFADDADGRGYRSLRTTFANLVPVGYSDERNIIMGHLKGGVFIENYLERFGVERLRELVNHVWDTAFTLPLPPDEVEPSKNAVASSPVLVT